MLEPEHPPGGPHRAEPAGDGPTPSTAATRFVADVERALEDPQTARRLSLAGVRARIDVTDAGEAVTLLLDRFPPQVLLGTGSQEPTVRLAVGSDDLDSMLAEGSHLPMAILAGDVVFEGSVRKLLRVLPILRAAVDAVRFARDDDPSA
ncbi:SCP2 sterol-binding domain-containing protein [Patulibacter sp. NPDC049589]|uniref:SCP2 sterol-binding domain-containing protein n=1 Tax=Patulibacter sp. NPDC049589 TaxID=3154731 RepID=UPI003433FFC4